LYIQLFRYITLQVCPVVLITRSTLDTLDTTHTGCVQCYRLHGSVDTNTPAIDPFQLSKHTRNTDTIYAVKIVNKRPRNLLNKIQNVFINGK